MDAGRLQGPRYTPQGGTENSPLEGCVNGRDESGTETEQLPSRHPNREKSAF